MSFPKEVTRITTHKKPKHQLYQPGFNDDNGCWLEGAWVTVTPAQYEARKTEHEAWYGKIRSAKQHYRDPAVPFEKMTPAQKQAFSHFSGQGVVYCRGAEGGVGPVYIELTADKIRQDSVDWFKATGRKILKVVKMPDGTLVDQKVQFSVPDEVVEVEEGEAPDPWKEIVKQNKEREDQMMDAFLGGPPDGLGGLPGMDGFSMGDMVDQMAVHSLIRLEESIIRDEFSLSRGAPPTDTTTSTAIEPATFRPGRRSGRSSAIDSWRFTSRLKTATTSARGSTLTTPMGSCTATSSRCSGTTAPTSPGVSAMCPGPRKPPRKR